MSRELIIQVISTKKALYQEEHDLHLQEIALDEEFIFANEEKLVEKQERLLELEAKQLHTQLKLKRAHLFGFRLAKGYDSHCIFCFVEHEALPKMVKIEPRILGTHLLKCESCGRELKVEP